MQMIKLQLVCFILVISLYDYYKKNKCIRTSYNYIYRAMIINLMVNLIFDMITVYTVNHISEVPYLINSIVHRIFIFTIDLFAFLLYLYMLSYARHTEEINKWQVRASFLPIIISFVIVLLGRIYYQKDIYTNYSYGSVVNTIYISTAFYILATFYYYLKNNKKIQIEIIIGIFRAIIIVVAGMLMQAVNPTLLISGAIQILVIFTLFLSFENPAEFIDKTTGVFNQYAFLKVISDKVLISRCFYVVAVYIGEGENDQILKNIITTYEKDAYILSEGCVAIITYDHNIIELFKSKIIEKINDVEDIFICKFPDEIEDPQSLIEKIKKFGIEARDRRIYIDDSTGVRNRNAYEKQIDEINTRKSDLRGLWGIMVDVNYLKRTNDTYGHAKGDHLIQITAKILKETIKNSNVYRIGGDEFAALLDHYNEKRAYKLVCAIREKQKEYNEKEDVPIEFSIGHAYFDIEKDVYVEDMMKRADKNMYDNKRRNHESREQNEKRLY